MKRILWFACLSLACRLAIGVEPTGGLADAALNPSDLGSQWTRRIEYLFDPKANPPEIFQVVTNFSRRPPLSPGEAEKLIARQTEERRDFAVRNLALVGAEAEIILSYYDSKRRVQFSMHLYRYKTAEGLQDMWKRRRESPEFNATRTGGKEVVYTKVGQVFPGGVKASLPSVEEREGVYHVLVSPGQPESGDPGLSLVNRQVEKLRATEPHAPRASGPPRQ